MHVAKKLRLCSVGCDVACPWLEGICGTVSDRDPSAIERGFHCLAHSLDPIRYGTLQGYIFFDEERIFTNTELVAIFWNRQSYCLVQRVVLADRQPVRAQRLNVERCCVRTIPNVRNEFCLCLRPGKLSRKHIRAMLAQCVTDNLFGRYAVWPLDTTI